MASRLQEGVVGGGDRDKDWALQYKVLELEKEMKVTRIRLIMFAEDDADTPHADATGVEKQHQEMPSASTHIKEQHQETQSAETPAGICLTPQELHRKQSARKVKRLKNKCIKGDLMLTAKKWRSMLFRSGV